MTPPRRLGVLGGMGPLATVDFLRKLVCKTPAAADQGHIPVIVYSVPQIPDRVAPIVQGCGESPLPAMRAGLRTLEGAGVAGIAIPCITAHYWYEELAASTPLPVIHIADAVSSALARCAAPDTRVGLLGTAATLAAGFFQAHLEQMGYEVMLPTERDLCDCVLPAITAVKRFDEEAACLCSSAAVQALLAAGADRVVLACTELPLAMQGADESLRERCVDSVAALADACVSWALSRGD